MHDRDLEHAERLFSVGQIDGAIDALKRVLTDDPDHAAAHARLAICLLRKRRLYAARLESDIAMTLAPDSTLSQWVGAELAIASRDFDRAGRLTEQLLSSAPEEAEFYRLKARLLELTGRGRERLATLQRALEVQPDDPETLAELADYHRTHGALDEAERFAREALALSAGNASALIAMGHILLGRGDVEGAREHALSVLQADAEDTGALHLMTVVKARGNPLLGLWWRYATWGMRVGPTRNIVVLLAAYLVYRGLDIWASDNAAAGLSGMITIAWLAIVAYSFIGPMLFSRALARELESVRLRRF